MSGAESVAAFLAVVESVIHFGAVKYFPPQDTVAVTLHVNHRNNATVLFAKERDEHPYMRSYFAAIGGGAVTIIMGDPLKKTHVVAACGIRSAIDSWMRARPVPCGCNLPKLKVPHEEFAKFCAHARDVAAAANEDVVFDLAVQISHGFVPEDQSVDFHIQKSETTEVTQMTSVGPIFSPKTVVTRIM